jgi:hypothetical protein
MLGATLRLRALALALLVASPARAELPPEEWERLHIEAARLQAKVGEGDRKKALIDAVRKEDSARSARLLVGFAASSATRRDDLVPRTANAADDFLKIDRQLRKKHGRGVKREVLEKDSAWRKRRTALDELRADLDTECAVLEAVGEALAALRSEGAAALFADAADPDVAAARKAVEVRTAIVAALCAQPGDRFEGAILAFATEADMPHVRVRVLDRIAARKMPGGFDVAVPCLGAKEPLVVRAAVAALKALDDPRAVPPLVKARQGARGLAAEEIDLLLRRFTGKKFSGAGADAMWAGWWKSEGEAWLASAGPERFEGGVGGSGGADFYGIETRSDRIVFVLDRSYSMRLPVPQKGPVSGAKRDEGVAGGTKLEVAKNELERTIRKLPPDVHFGVVFFGANVKSWQQPPGLLAATPENRKRAIDWFAALDPEGSTPIFAALSEALRYAKVGGGKSATDPAGADTIFLLSDGAPTRPGTDELLLGPELEAAIQDFLEANRGFRCVVHTIGVGPEQNRELMMRLARETGGTYRAVGVD